MIGIKKNSEALGRIRMYLFLSLIFFVISITSFFLKDTKIAMASLLFAFASIHYSYLNSIQADVCLSIAQSEEATLEIKSLKKENAR